MPRDALSKPSSPSTSTLCIPQRMDIAPPSSKPPTFFGLPPFEKLTTSTKTVMVYANIEFNLQQLFHAIALTDVEVPRTKKQKNVDKKKIAAPYGAIIGLQSRTMIRGVDIRKKNKQWCTVCRPVTQVSFENVKPKKILTLTEFLVDVEGTDIRRIKYHCSKCQRDYEQHELKKIGHFLNQLTIVLSLGNQPIINIMMFKDNLKIAGCKNDDDAKEAVMILWENYISKVPESFKHKELSIPKDVRFTFETVMRNVDFKLGFMINRAALNDLMNEERYADRVKLSQYEATSNTNVNVKMHSIKPKNFLYDCLVFPQKGKPRLIDVESIDHKKVKKPKRGGESITFIVFSSSEIILSGRYDENMKDMYEFFVNTVFTRKKDVAEQLIQPNRSLLESILRSG